MEHASKALTTIKSKALGCKFLSQSLILTILFRSDRQVPP